MNKKEALAQGYTKITLNISKKDLREADVSNGLDCPITRALSRAGYPNLMDYADRLAIKDKERYITGNHLDVLPTVGYAGIFYKVLNNYGINAKAFQWTFYVKLN